MKIKELEQLATKMVGDGKSPNVFFVGRHGNIEAVLTHLGAEDAIAYARLVGATTVEDRKTGVVWDRDAGDR